MRKITQQSVVKKNLRIGEAKQNTHREREREAQRMSLFIKMQQLQYMNITFSSKINLLRLKYGGTFVCRLLNVSFKVVMNSKIDYNCFYIE